MSDKIPTDFLNLIIHDLKDDPSLSGLCAGFEDGKWRCDQFAAHLMEWLPDFALKDKEKRKMNSATAIKFIRKAAITVYITEKYKRRGEFGELILHALMRSVFGTLPAVNKLYFKDNPNDIVKGFDAVHIVGGESDIELWLGEVKFYSDIQSAIRDVIIELGDHTNRDYLRNEFILITNKLDEDWPYFNKLQKLLDPNISLDEIFKSITFPVLLTYNSEILKDHTEINDEYRKAIEKEFLSHHLSFKNKSNKLELKIHLFLIPLNEKENLIEALHRKLALWQEI